MLIHVKLDIFFFSQSILPTHISHFPFHSMRNYFGTRLFVTKAKGAYPVQFLNVDMTIIRVMVFFMAQKNSTSQNVRSDSSFTTVSNWIGWTMWKK